MAINKCSTCLATCIEDCIEWQCNPDAVQGDELDAQLEQIHEAQLETFTPTREDDNYIPF